MLGPTGSSRAKGLVIVSFSTLVRVYFVPGQVVARCTVGGFEERYEVTRPLIVKAGEDGWVDVVVKVQSWSDVMNFHSRGRGNKAIWGIRSVGNSKFYYLSFPPQQNKPKPGKGHTKIGSGLEMLLRAKVAD